MNESFKLESKELSPIEREITATVAEAWLKERIEAGLKEVRKHAQLKGFRPGRVPMSLVKKMFLPNVLQETQTDAIQATLEEVYPQLQVMPVSSPNLTKVEAYKGEGDMTFTFTIEIRPELGDVAFDGIELERERIDVKEELVDATLERARTARANLIDLDEDRDVVEKGDFVDLDFQGIVDGKPIKDLKGEHAVMETDRQSRIPQFEENLIGKKVGEDFRFDVTFPGDHPVEDMRGKNVTFEGKIHGIKVRDLPELDDEFAKDMDFENLDALKEHIRGDLKKHEENQQKRDFAQRLFEQLRSKNPFDMPPSLIQRYTIDLAEERKKQFEQMGLPAGQIDFGSEEILATLRPEAEDRLRNTFLQDKLAKQENLTVTDEDYEAFYQKMADETKGNVARIKAQYDKPEIRENLMYQILEDKVMAFLEENVTINEVEPGTFAKRALKEEEEARKDDFNPEQGDIEPAPEKKDEE